MTQQRPPGVCPRETKMSVPTKRRTQCSRRLRHDGPCHQRLPSVEERTLCLCAGWKGRSTVHTRPGEPGRAKQDCTTVQRVPDVIHEMPRVGTLDPAAAPQPPGSGWERGCLSGPGTSLGWWELSRAGCGGGRPSSKLLNGCVTRQASCALMTLSNVTW